MTALRVLGIIGIVFTVICFICICVFLETDPSASAGWGMYGLMYMLALSIVACVQGKSKQ